MRPLNRPMFKYGGPIKEGIMNGMKEKQAINTVGSPLAPKDETGRQGYAVPIIGAGLMAAARFLPAAYRGFRAARAYTPLSQNLGVKGRLIDIFKPKGGLQLGMPSAGEGAGFRVGSFLRQNPLTSLPLAGMAIEGGGRAAAGLAKMTPDLLKSYANAVIPFADPFKTGPEVPEKKDGTGIKRGDEKNKNVGSVTGTTKPGEAGGTTIKTDAEKRQINEDRINETKQKYYKLMGIDKMNKESVYDSLIDASKIIQQEGGDLKGSIKSGNLQSQLISAISKNLDKSTDLKKQIDAAILKGEITKDINKGKDALAAELTKKRIQVADKQLAGPTLNETRAAYQKSGEPLTGQNLYAEATRAGEDIKGILDTKTAGKFLTNNPTLTEADFVKQVQENRVKEGQTLLPEGNYVVNGRIVHISSGGLVDKFIF